MVLLCCVKIFHKERHEAPVTGTNADGTLAWRNAPAGRFLIMALVSVPFLTVPAIMTGEFQDTAVFGAVSRETTFISLEGTICIEGTTLVERLHLGETRASGTVLMLVMMSVRCRRISIVVTGRFQDAAVFGAGEPNETTLVSGGW